MRILFRLSGRIDYIRQQQRRKEHVHKKSMSQNIVLQFITQYPKKCKIATPKKQQEFNPFHFERQQPVWKIDIA